MVTDVLVDPEVVVDVTNSPSFEDAAVLEFCEKSSRNLLAAEADAGVGHHVAVSIVGADRIPYSGYLRAKVASPAPVTALTPEEGDAATASCPRSCSLVTSFLPISPLPPMTTIFMTHLS